MIFRNLVRSHDKAECYELLTQHIRQTQSELIMLSKQSFTEITYGLFNDNIKSLRHAADVISQEKDKWKRYRRKEIIGMRKIDYLLAVEKNTWFHLGCNSCSQMIYCLKRMLEPCMEHVDNNFNPMPRAYAEQFSPICRDTEQMLQRVYDLITTGDFSHADEVLVNGNALKSRISQIRHDIQDQLQRENSNIKVILLYLNSLQETQELISASRHLLRASRRFQQP